MRYRIDGRGGQPGRLKETSTQWIAPSQKDIRTDTLETCLWAAADQLRANSGLTSAQYSQSVLGLIFLRFAEVRFLAQRTALEKKATGGRRGSRVDEPAAYQAVGVPNLRGTRRAPAAYRATPYHGYPVGLRRVGPEQPAAHCDVGGDGPRPLRWFIHFRFPGHEKLQRVPSPLGDIPGWTVANLDTIKARQPYAMNGGPFGSKLCTRDYVAEGVPVIRGSNLSESGRFNASDFVFVSKEKAVELHLNLARPGDIVVTQRGTLGQIGMIPSGIGYDSFVISQSQMKITINPIEASREYIFFFLRSDEASQRIKNLASSSGVPHINLAVLREFQILLLPFDFRKGSVIARSAQKQLSRR